MKNNAFKLMLLFMLVNNSLFAQTTQIIAHRGLWDCPGSAQNSIASLNKAHEAQIYGSEFDVQITADGILVVNHDDSIQGIDIATTAYEKLKTITLSNQEVLPTLEEYLLQGKQHKSTQLILEIKSQKEEEREKKMVEKILRLVNKLQLENQIEYISFSMNICKELIRLSPQASVAFLQSDVSPKELKEIGFTGLDYHYKVLIEKPEWIKEAKELGLTVNVWTVNDPELMKRFIEQRVDFITTDKPIELKQLVHLLSKSEPERSRDF